MIAIRCAKCGSSFQVEDDYLGKDVQCPCGYVFAVQAPRKTMLAGEPRDGKTSLQAPPFPENAAEPADGPRWFVRRNQEKFGPYAVAQLQQFIASRELVPADYVWKDGMTGWKEAGSVEEIFPKRAPPASSSRSRLLSALHAYHQLTTGRLFDRFLNRMRTLISERFLEASFRFLRACGNYGLTAAMLIGLGYSVLFAVRTDRLSLVLLGAGGVLALAVLQYTALRIGSALDVLVQSTRHALASNAFLDCFALLNLALGIFGFLALTLFALREGGAVPFAQGLAALIVCTYVAGLSLNPGTLNLHFSPVVTAGEEALGLLAFFLKLFLRLIPLCYGIGIAIGTLGLLGACLFAITGDPAAPTTWALGTNSLILIAGSAALPFAGYLTFILCYLTVDLIRALLTLPEKTGGVLARKRDE